MLVVLGASLQAEVSIEVTVSCFDCPLFADEDSIVILEVVATSIQATIPNFMTKFKKLFLKEVGEDRFFPSSATSRPFPV